MKVLWITPASIALLTGICLTPMQASAQNAVTELIVLTTKSRLCDMLKPSLEGRITLNNPPQDLRVIYDGIASLRQIASQPDTDPKTKKLAMEGVECGDSVYYMLYHKYITR